MERKQARNRSIHQLSAFDSNNTHNGVATLEEAAYRLQRKSGKGSAHARRDKATSRAESQRMRRGRSLHNVLNSSGHQRHRRLTPSPRSHVTAVTAVKLDIHWFWIYLVARRKIDHVEPQKFSLPLFLLVAILSGLRADSGVGHAPGRALVSGLGLGGSLPGSDI